MKKYHVKHIILFLLLFFIIDQSIYHSLDWLRENTKNDYGSLNKMYRGEINADAVFFGSSRIYCHIEPLVFEKSSGLAAYNMAMDASNCFQHYFTIKEYVKFNKKPKVIVVEADMESFGTVGLRFKKELFRPYIYKSMSVMNLLYNTPLKKLQIPMMSLAYRNRVLRTIFKYFHPPQNETNDYIIINGSYLKKPVKGDSTINKSPSLGIIFSEDRKDVYKDIVQYCKNQNIPLFFIATPRYIGDVISSKNYNTIINFFTDLAKENDNTYFLNLGNDNKFNSNPYYFRGNRHMNLIGAKIFSDKLGLIIKEKLL